MIGTEVSCSTPTRLRGRPPLISNTLLDSNFPSLFNSTSASTFIFHHVRAAIVFSDLAPFTFSSLILNKNSATFTHLSASPSHKPSYIVRSRLRHYSSLLNSTFNSIQLLINLCSTSTTAKQHREHELQTQMSLQLDLFTSIHTYDAKKRKLIEDWRKSRLTYRREVRYSTVSTSQEIQRILIFQSNEAIVMMMSREALLKIIGTSYGDVDEYLICTLKWLMKTGVDGE